MPELPEVETIAVELKKAGLVGTVITDAHVSWPRSIATHAPCDFCAQLIGQRITHINRRGKFIVITLTKDTLLIHLRMTGKFTLSTPSMNHERVRLQLDDGRTLYYEDQRKFGKWYLLRDPADKLAQIGLEPLNKDFTLTAWRNALAGHKRQIKGFLLNQHHVAGLGNIYVDEALWEAQIHPERNISSLTPNEIKRLHDAIPKVLKRGLLNKGTTLGTTQSNYTRLNGRGENQTYLKVFRREGQSCPRCQSRIEKIRVAQRGTHFCPTCQKN